MSLNQKTRRVFKLLRLTMIVLNAVRDFADGLTRGFALFFTERRDLTTYTPRAEKRRSR